LAQPPQADVQRPQRFHQRLEELGLRGAIVGRRHPWTFIHGEGPRPEPVRHGTTCTVRRFSPSPPTPMTGGRSRSTRAFPATTSRAVSSTCPRSDPYPTRTLRASWRTAP